MKSSALSIMIEASNLTKVFGNVTAVDRVSFFVGKGETLGLIGTSGCGKTTLLRMINSLIEPTAGTVLIDGRDIRGADPVALRRRIGYVIQDVGLFPHYTVEQNVAVVPGLLGWERERIRTRTRELLEMVGLSPGDFMDRLPDELSGGQQQRVGLARALAGDPPIVLLDEPFGALDPITRGKLQAEFKRLKQRLNKTMIMVTHDVFEAFDLCDRLCLMDAGRVQQHGMPKDLVFSPANEFVSSFIGPHRFQLELKSTALWEVMGEARPMGKEGGDAPHARTFTPDACLLDVLQAVERPGQGSLPVHVVDDGGDVVIKTTGEELLAAFSRKKGKTRAE